MNIELLGRKAVEIIKSKWGLPESGFLAGGSIANIIWELVSGNPAVVNDIDIFYFDGIKKDLDRNDKTSLFNWSSKETKYYEDYTGLCFSNRLKEFYSIVSAERDGMFNNIKYKSNSEDPSLIIRSFDINATRVGYHIDEDKIYWTPEFENFLLNKKLEVCNVMTPCHTALRITKKSFDLNVRVDKFEYKLLQYSLSRGFSDKIKWRFKEKYRDMFEKYSDILGKYFSLQRAEDTENYVLINYSEVVQLWFLEPKIQTVNKDILGDYIQYQNKCSTIFEDPNLHSIYNTQDFLFYMRNIWKNEQLKSLWSKLHYFFVSDNYVDGEFNQEDIDLLFRFSQNAPNSIENLKGMKLSEQISVIKKFLDRYKDDPIVAISILESIKVDKNIELDEQTALILELSVRKSIINDTKNKVGRIVRGEYNNKLI